VGGRDLRGGTGGSRGQGEAHRLMLEEDCLEFAAVFAQNLAWCRSEQVRKDRDESVDQLGPD